MDHSPVSVAIIGLGLGRYFINELKDYAAAEITALVDLDATRLTEANALLSKPAATFGDYHEMLRTVRPELVFVCLPNFLHKQVTIDCLEAGSAVLCEKPMAMTVAECVEMRDAAQRTDGWLGIDLSYRFHGASIACHDLVASGALGDIYHGYTTWRRRDGIPGFGGWFGQKKLSGGGPLIDLGVHRLDLAMWLMGDVKPVSVSGAAHHKIGVPRAEAQGKAFDVEDLAAGFIRFDGGQSLVFEISWAGLEANKEPMETRILGTQGGLTQHNGGQGYTTHATYTTNVAGHLSVGDLSYDGNPKHAVQVAVDCVAEKRPFPVTAADGIRVQQVLNALYESASTGQEVRIAPV